MTRFRYLTDPQVSQAGQQAQRAAATTRANGSVPAGRSEVRESRAAAYGKAGVRAAAAIPSGLRRVRGFPSEIRSKLVTKDGQKFLEVEGYASTFHQPYEMWDMPCSGETSTLPQPRRSCR